MPPKQSPTQPFVRFAPLGELRVYVVYEHELDLLAEGGPSSVLKDVGFALLPAALGIVVTMAASQLSDLNFVLFTCVALILALAGGICLALWRRDHASAGRLLREIKNRMPPPTPTPTPP